MRGESRLRFVTLSFVISFRDFEKSGIVNREITNAPTLALTTHALTKRQQPYVMASDRKIFLNPGKTEPA